MLGKYILVCTFLYYFISVIYVTNKGINCLHSESTGLHMQQKYIEFYLTNIIITLDIYLLHSLAITCMPFLSVYKNIHIQKT